MQYSLAFAPDVLPYRDGQDVPAGYELDESVNSGLLIGGGVTLGIAYAASVAMAVGSGFEDGSAWLAAPVIGPWGAMLSRGNPCDIDGQKLPSDECIDTAMGEARTVGVLLVDGLVQATGATLMIVGALSTRKELVRTQTARVWVAPRQVGRGGYGVGVAGAF